MVIYQIFLRAMTKEGTLRAAEEHLQEIAALGTDVVYLCPVVQADDDENLEYWSERQKKAGFNSPLNPYRMKDYFTIDPEYGDDDALRSFVQHTHALGMKVMLDLVYFHCGPTAVFLKEHPDYIVRRADGSPDTGVWCFPKLNYDNPALCEYMYGNMTYFIEKFDVDGYRCDVGDLVPEFFWQEGIRRCRALRPDFLMLNEGRPEPVKNAGFDWFYGFEWTCAWRDLFLNGHGAEDLKAAHEKFAGGYTYLRALTNHDYANDVYERRYDAVQPCERVDLAFVVNALIDGVMFLYNGDEVCDDHRHSIWFSRGYSAGLDCTVDWARANTPEAERRRALIHDLIALRKSEPFAAGKTVWLEAAGSRLAFAREKDGQRAVVAVNFGAEREAFALPCAAEKMLIGRGAQMSGETLKLEPYGYAAVLLKD